MHVVLDLHDFNPQPAHANGLLRGRLFCDGFWFFVMLYHSSRSGRTFVIQQQLKIRGNQQDEGLKKLVLDSDGSMEVWEDHDGVPKEVPVGILEEASPDLVKGIFRVVYKR